MFTMDGRTGARFSVVKKALDTASPFQRWLPAGNEAHGHRSETGRQEAMKRGSGYQGFKARALSRPGVREAYDESLDDLRIAVRLAELREKSGMTQTELATKIHTSPAVISRLEQGRNVELRTLKRVAAALDARLTIEPLAT
jgi:ribosome-binding protein aMBF1 (putative translation factor)